MNNIDENDKKIAISVYMNNITNNTFKPANEDTYYDVQISNKLPIIPTEQIKDYDKLIKMVNSLNIENEKMILSDYDVTLLSAKVEDNNLIIRFTDSLNKDDFAVKRTIFDAAYIFNRDLFTQFGICFSIASLEFDHVDFKGSYVEAKRDLDKIEFFQYKELNVSNDPLLRKVFFHDTEVDVVTNKKASEDEIKEALIKYGIFTCYFSKGSNGECSGACWNDELKNNYYATAYYNYITDCKLTDSNYLYKEEE